MFKANLYVPREGIFKLLEFKSLALLLAKAKEQEKYRLKVYDGSHEYLCVYNPKHGWVIDRETKI